MKNIFSGEMKNKKDQKNLESIMKTIITSTKEKVKNEACLKLNEIFENSIEVSLNFDYLLTAIDDLSECSSLQCKKIWLQVISSLTIQLAIQIIKFRAEYRNVLFNKMMKIVFELKHEENALKIKVLNP
jgi:hypothetical protein